MKILQKSMESSMQMAFILPLVASRIAPLDEIIADGRTGTLATVGDPEAFVRAAEPLLTDPDLRRQMVDAWRRHK